MKSCTSATTVLLGRPLCTYPLERIVLKPFHVPDNWLKGLCHSCSVHFVNKPYYASFNWLSMKLEKLLVNDKITVSCQINVFWALYQTIQTTKMNFEKLLGEQVFKNHNCNSFQSPSSLSMRVSFCISMLSIPCLRVLSGYFCFT